MRREPSLPQWQRGVVIPLTMMAILLVAIIALGHAPPLLSGPSPTIPPYPNVSGAATYPGGWELRVFGEAFGGFATPDSSAAVSQYYGERLSEQGWRNGWYQNRFGYCYTLLIVPDSAVAANRPVGATGIGLKLRQAFRSELGTSAPRGASKRPIASNPRPIPV